MVNSPAHIQKPQDTAPQSRAGADVALPASFAQERLWFLGQYEPGSPLYNIPLAYDISGPLNIDALRESLLDVVRRHESLRTNLVFENGELLQLIHGNAACPFETRDLPDLPAQERESRADDAMRAFIRMPFNLSAEPLLRILVLGFDGQSHRLVLNVHHSIFDGVSVGIFFRELAEFYSARLEGRAPSLKPLAIQYGDFAAWQRQSLQGSLLEKHLVFWKDRLRDMPPPLDLPVDRQPPAQPTTKGGDYFFTLPADLALGLRELCHREGVTLFMGLMAAFQTLLFRHTGQERMLVGAPVANRSRAETEQLIGLFVNTVLLRGDFHDDPRVRELLRRVKNETLAAVEHGDLPFEKLVHELQLGRRDGRNPLFRTMLVLQDHAMAASLPGLRLSPHPAALGTAALDLLIEMIDEGTGIRCGVSYSADLFDAATIGLLAGHFLTLLRGMVESPDSRVSSLPLLTPGEQEQLRDWNRTDRDFPGDQTLASLFEKCAARTPLAPALIDGCEQLTYAALDKRANAVARELVARGIRPGSLVGLPAERSARFIIAMLGILKAGGAYVPLDAAEPAERAGIMRSRCAHVLSWDTMQSGDAEACPPRETDSGLPACVLFTSGSTGIPKGVLVPHRAISRLVLNNGFAAFSENDVVAFASNVCFDAATFEIWGALLNGATLVVVPREIIVSAGELAAFLTAHRITTLFLTTSLFNQMAAAEPAMFSKLKCLVFGGEPADAHAVRQVLANGKPERLVNGYGPTETTTFAVCHTIERIDGDQIPIGRPIANTRAYILDRALNELPVGVSGELFIGGPGVALGYVNDPALTAGRFVETKFGRLYKTGDLAGWRADGAISYRGRIDSQIKLRGFRIEPGEIETALQAHPDIRQAAVVAQPQTGGDRALVGYLVASAETRTDAAVLRTFLTSSLPAQMIPRSFIWLESLPLTANGKLDHRKLPKPPDATPNPVASAQPRNPIEHGISELWTQVLGRNGFSLQDDFFAAGGHSLLALRMLADIRKKFGVEVPARRLFETPTIEGLARFVAGHLPSAAPEPKAFRSLIAIQRGDPARTPLFLVPGGWGGEIEFLVYAELSRHLDPALPVWGLKARGAGTAESPHASVAEMAADYLAELRAIQPHGPYFIAGECVGGICAAEMACQLEEAGERVALLMLLDTTVPAPSLLQEYVHEESRKRASEFHDTSVHQRIRHHLDKMTGLSLGGKFGYLLKKATRHETVAPAAEAPVVEQYPRGQKEYPVTLMRHHLRAYRGAVTLLLDDESSRLYGHLGWDKAPIGKLETHTVPGNHITCIRGHAPTAAAKMRELIQRATAEAHP